MILVYYKYTNLYLDLDLTLTGYLFDLDQSNICRDIQKIDGLIRQYPFLKNYQMTKRLKRPEEGKQSLFQALWLL